LPPGKQVLGGLAGVLAAQAIPNLILPAQNKGMIGPLLELVSAIGASFALKAIAGAEIGRAALVGGGIRAAYRVVSEQGLLKAIPGLSGTEAVGPVPGFAGYVDPALAGFIDAAPMLPPGGSELDGYQGDYEYEFLR
jgi:hypothetical protein